MGLNWRSRDIRCYDIDTSHEATRRNDNRNRTKIAPIRNRTLIPVTRGQRAYELQHLTKKLTQGSPSDLSRLPAANDVKPHPLFTVCEGDIEAWERGSG